MCVQVKPSAAQTLVVSFFDQPIDLATGVQAGHRILEHTGYHFEARLMAGRHLLRFEHKSQLACELLAEEGVAATAMCTPVAACPCQGERDFEHRFVQSGLTYLNTFQTETLSENLYRGTVKEIRMLAEESKALSREWEDSVGPCLSVLDAQRFQKQIHAQAYHLFARGGLIIRTQSIFEHI